MSDRLLTAREVADHLGVKPDWVLRRWQAGELPGYRLSTNDNGRPVRFRLSEVEAWLREKRGGGIRVVG